MGGVLAKGGEEGPVFFGEKGGAECVRRYRIGYSRWCGKLSLLPGASSVVGDVKRYLGMQHAFRCELLGCHPTRLLSDGLECSDRGEGERAGLLPGIASVTGRVERGCVVRLS